MADQRFKSIRNTEFSLNKQFGKRIIQKCSELKKVRFIPTNISLLDKALGIGGIPAGKIVEIYGPESAGKTTLALHIAKQAKCALYIDSDYGLIPEQIEGFANVYLLYINTLEAALQAVM